MMKKSKVDAIVIHCSATRADVDIHACDIERWHKQKGWKTVGYHYVIDLSGNIETGRPTDEVGAHAVGYNDHSIGICYVGGLDSLGKPCDTRTGAQKEALRNLIYELVQEFPITDVLGHRDTGANKDCPCFDVRAEFPMAKITGEKR